MAAARTVRPLGAYISIVEAAVANTPGRRSLAVSERTPTVTSLATDWRAARARDPDFSGVQWNQRIEVDTVTLDGLIERFGVPAFIKIDVEERAGRPFRIGTAGAGSLVRISAASARGSTSVPGAPGVPGSIRVFNWSIGESGQLASERWLDALDVLERLAHSCCAAPPRRRLCQLS